jgi:hypothetical protein
MTDLSSLPPVATPEPAATTAIAKQPSPPSPSPQPSPPQQQGTSTGAAPTDTSTPGIPYQLHYDAETQRFIIEARDPKTGAIIIALPPQTALQHIQASAAVTDASPLGKRVDENA